MKKSLLCLLIISLIYLIPFDVSGQKKKYSISIETPDDVDIVVLQNGRPVEPNTPRLPDYIIREDNNRFMMTIGGYVKPIIGWDIGNDLPDILFIPSQIPAPAKRGNKIDFFSNPLHSALDFHFVALPGTKDQLTAYVKFTYNGTAAGVLLNNLYLKYRGFTVGRVTTIFSDGASIPFTIDPQGPNGAVNVHSYQTSYISKSYNGFSFGVSMELPTFDKYAGAYHGDDFPDSNDIQYYEEASQPIPDFPAYIQYQGRGMNRIRLSGIVRYFSYRDKINDKTDAVWGWGAQVSGNLQPIKPLTLYFQGVYGRGIANYVQDLNGLHVSYVPKSIQPGKMKSTPMLGWLGGVKYDINEKMCSSIIFSQARVWDSGNYYPDYRYGLYACGNFFYNITPFLRYGVEYVWGKHSKYNSIHGTDNRLQTTIIFSF